MAERTLERSSWFFFISSVRNSRFSERVPLVSPSLTILTKSSTKTRWNGRSETEMNWPFSTSAISSSRMILKLRLLTWRRKSLRLSTSVMPDLTIIERCLVKRIFSESGTLKNCLFSPRNQFLFMHYPQHLFDGSGPLLYFFEAVLNHGGHSLFSCNSFDFSR